MSEPSVNNKHWPPQSLSAHTKRDARQFPLDPQLFVVMPYAAYMVLKLRKVSRARYPTETGPRRNRI